MSRLEESSENAALSSLGSALRQLRVAAGLTGAEAAELIDRSQATVSKIETGKRGIPPTKLLNAYLEAVGAADDERDRIWEQYDLALLDPSSFAVIKSVGLERKQAQFAVLENEARLIRDFQNCVFPGLMQTPDYSRAVFSALGLGVERARAAANQRQQRQVIVNDPQRKFFFVFCDAALFSSHGLHANEMAQQLEMLIARAMAPNLEMRILDSRRGWPISASNPFCIIDERYVSAETTMKELTSTDANEIREYARSFDELWTAALSAADTVEALKRTRAELVK